MSKNTPQAEFCLSRGILAALDGISISCCTPPAYCCAGYISTRCRNARTHAAAGRKQRRKHRTHAPASSELIAANSKSGGKAASLSEPEFTEFTAGLL